MLPEWTVVGFSGHRKLTDPKVASDAIRKVFDRLAAKHSLLASVSSAASGADTLFVEEVARRNLPYLLVLPFSETRFQQDFSPADWQRILPLIEKATHVEEVAGEESTKGAYMETGILTADRADIMVVVWDGKPAAGFGGTGDVVDYVRALGKPLITIEPNSGQIAEERLEQLPAKSLPTGWNDNPRETVEKHFQELDEIAGLHAPRSRHLVLLRILFQLTASAIGSFAFAFARKINDGAALLLTLIELFLLGFAFFSSLQHRKKHREWMKNRIAAEICRSFIAMWHMQRTDYSPKISIEGFNRLGRNLRLIRIMDKSPLQSLETVRDEYLKERVENQIAYFSWHSGNARGHDQKLKAAAFISTTLATALSLLVFTLSGLKYLDVGPHLPDLIMNILKFLSLLLSLASAVAISVMITQDYSRRAVRYGEMVNILEDAAKRLKMVRTWNSLVRIAVETEEELLQEVVEWHSFRQFAGEPR